MNNMESDRQERNTTTSINSKLKQLEETHLKILTNSGIKNDTIDDLGLEQMSKTRHELTDLLREVHVATLNASEDINQKNRDKCILSHILLKDRIEVDLNLFVSGFYYLLDERKSAKSLSHTWGVFLIAFAVPYLTSNIPVLTNMLGNYFGLFNSVVYGIAFAVGVYMLVSNKLKSKRLLKKNVTKNKGKLEDYSL